MSHRMPGGWGFPYGGPFFRGPLYIPSPALRAPIVALPPDYTFYSRKVILIPASPPPPAPKQFKWQMPSPAGNTDIFATAPLYDVQQAAPQLSVPEPPGHPTWQTKLPPDWPGVNADALEMMPQQKPPRSGSQFKPPTSFSPGGAMPNKKTGELKDNALQRALAATKTRSLTEAPSVNALSSSLLDATAIFLWGLGLLILMIWTRNLVHSAAEGIAVGEYRARLWVDARRTNIKGAFDRRRDWARHVFWSLHSDTKLEKVLRKRNDGVERLINRAQTLYEQTERFETSNWPALHMYGRFLRKRAVHYTAEAIAMQKKIDRLSPLFARIISDRQDRRAAGMLESARRLCEEIVQANDVAATPALAELYKLRNQIDWDALIPLHVSGSIRGQIAKAYRKMGGTTSLSEARTAYVYIKRLTGSS